MPEKRRSPADPRYWFPAKRYGWGWGLPSTWEGWVVLGVYVGLLVALCVLVPADRHPYWFWAGLGTIVTTLIAIGLWKAEPLGWRMVSLNLSPQGRFTTKSEFLTPNY